MAQTWENDQQVLARHEDLIPKVILGTEADPVQVMVYKINKDDSRVEWFKIHYSDGIRTTGIYKGGVRYCSWCETQPLNEAGQSAPLNTSGYCAQRHNNKAYGVFCGAVYARYRRIFNPRFSGYRSHTSRDKCKNCGEQLLRTNTTEYCNASKRPECRKAYQESQKGPFPVCKNEDCKRELRHYNTTGYCSMRPECQKALRKSQKRTGQACKNCGEQLLRTNTTGYCNSSKRPECRIAWRRRKADEELQKNPLPVCKNENCERKLQRRNTKGYCSNRLECQKAYRDSQKGPEQVCKNCGEQLRKNNTLGYCSTLKRPECRKLNLKAWRDSHRE